MCVCVCVCVLEREKERERERKSDPNKDIMNHALLLQAVVLFILHVTTDGKAWSPYDPRRKHCTGSDKTTKYVADRDNCGNWICGRGPCEECSPASFEGDVSNHLCHTQPKVEVQCEEDKNCEVWQTCLVVYSKGKVYKRTCVDTSAYSFKGDLPPTPKIIVNDGIEGMYVCMYIGVYL